MFASNCILSTNHVVLIKFTTGKSRKASFQIMWCIGMHKWNMLQKSQQLFGWNRRPDKIIRLTANTKACKFNKEDWLQIYDKFFFFFDPCPHKLQKLVL